MCLITHGNLVNPILKKRSINVYDVVALAFPPPTRSGDPPWYGIYLVLIVSWVQLSLDSTQPDMQNVMNITNRVRVKLSCLVSTLFGKGILLILGMFCHLRCFVVN